MRLQANYGRPQSAVFSSVRYRVAMLPGVRRIVPLRHWGCILTTPKSTRQLLYLYWVVLSPIRYWARKPHLCLTGAPEYGAMI
jgi:hypothetical protein